TPSETEIVLNSIGVPPASRMPRLTSTASSRWLRLHGIVSIQVVATPIIGRARSSSVKPTAFSIERAPARSGPSVIAALCRFAGSELTGRSYALAELVQARPPSHVTRAGPWGPALGEREEGYHPLVRHMLGTCCRRF